MTFHEFGSKDDPKVLLVHGLNIPWQMWEPEIRLLEKKYFLIVPALDGHDRESTDKFVSVSEEGEKIYRYCSDNYGNKLYMAIGMSMGAAVTIETLRRGITAEYLVFDSGVFAPAGPLVLTVNNKMQLAAKNGTRDGKDKYLKQLEPVFGKELAPHYIRLAKKMTDDDLIAASNSIGRYTMPDISFDDTKIIAFHGTVLMEILAKKSAALLKKRFPQAYIKIFKGYAHTELSVKRPAEFIEEIKKAQKLMSETSASVNK